LGRLDEDDAFQTQVSNRSLASEISDFVRDSTTSAASGGNFSRQATDIDKMVSIAVHEVLVKKALKAAVGECKFCVTIANPRGSDFPLIAVSEEFETMTGYMRNEILGVNCRFLNQGCDMDPAMLMDLRIASETGAAFTGLLPNRKKSGEMFLNLLDLRGLTVARHPRTGEDLWFLIGIQADVTDLALADEEVPEYHLSELQVLSDGIRANIRKELSEMALVGQTKSMGELPMLEKKQMTWQLLEDPEWRPGPALGQRRNEALDLANYASEGGANAESAQTSRTGAQAAPSSSSTALPDPVMKATLGSMPPVPEVVEQTGASQTKAECAEGEAKNQVPDTSIVETRTLMPTHGQMLLPLLFGAFALVGAYLLTLRKRSRSQG